jgi:hypothetical protein
MALVRDSSEYLTEVGVKHVVHLCLGTEQVEGAFSECENWNTCTAVPRVILLLTHISLSEAQQVYVTVTRKTCI